MNEVISQLDKTTEGKVVKDSQVSTLLMSYELIKELKKHANEKSELKSFIRSCIEEIMSEDSDINEINTTANIDGYQTPYAFDDNDEDRTKKV